MRPRSAETSEPAWVKRKMLSMKMRRSRPSSSRKYSAIVSPVSATRRRAPGGSFIWPKTIDILSMTPDSRISPRSCVPSRERSPTAQTVGALHRDRAHPAVAEVLLDLRDDELAVVTLDRQGVVDLGKLALLEPHVEDRPDDLDDLPCCLRFSCLRGLACLHRHLAYP